MTRIAICEPCPEIAGRIENLIAEASKLLQDTIQYDCFTSGKDFFDSLDRDDFYRIVYMNLKMGDIDGIEMGRKIRERFSSNETLLIYLSETIGFSTHIFDIQPFLYISLPLEDNDFIRKFFFSIEHLQEARNLFTCKKGSTIYQIKKKDIMCLESVGHDIILSAFAREDIIYRATLKSEHEKLKTVNFIRPHNSFIVNLDYVEEYHSGCLLMQNKKQVYISELRAKETRLAVMKFWEYRNV